MSGKVTVLSPLDNRSAVELGNKVFRKQLLPKSKINYKGRQLDFDDAYLDQVAQSFREQAFDSCPLVMAPADNSHTMSPTAATGRILGVERTPDGLDIIVEANDEAARVLSEDPRVGVSARIVEDYSRADGKSWRAALQHALITYAPRITGMRPWEPVECSQETDAVIDLSALTFTPEGDIKQEQASAESGEETPGKELVDMPPLSQEQQDTLKTLFTQWQEEASAASTETPETAPQPPVFQEVEVVEAPEAAQESEQLEAIAASEESSDGAVELAEIELATKVDRLEIQLAEVKAREDAANWKLEFSALVSEKGLSPAIVNLAEPLLKGSKHTVELSEGTTVDAGQVMRTVLDAVAKTYGKAVDLSAPVGSAHDGAAGDTEAQERAAFLASQRNFVK